MSTGPDQPHPFGVTLAGRALLLIGLALLAYQDSFLAPFYLDDFSNIVNAPAVRHPWDMEMFFTGNRPLGTWSFAVNFACHGLSLWGFHAVNLALHVFTGLVLFDLIRRTLRSQKDEELAHSATTLAWMIAALWLVHPLTTQAVTYIVQRYEVMAACFMVTSLWGLQRGHEGAPWVGYSLAVIAAVGASLSKETAVALPAIALLYDRCFLTGCWRETLRRAPLGAVMSIPLLRFVPSLMPASSEANAARVSAGFGLESITWQEYLRTQPEIILHYLRLSVWPRPLCFDYLWPVQNDATMIAATSLLVAGAAMGLIGWAIEGRVWAFPGAAFFLLLAPSSSVLPIADLAAEHRMYLPLACVLTVIVIGAWWLLRRIPEQQASLRTALGGAVVTITVAVLVTMTQARNQQYADPVRFWSSVIRVRPTNSRAWQGLGIAYLNRQEYPKAMNALLQGLNLAAHPAHRAELLAALAESLEHQGRSDDAERALRSAIQQAPDDRTTRLRLAALLARRGDLPGARDQLVEARKQNHSLEVESSYGSLLIEMGELSQAMKQLEATTRTWPDGHYAWCRLAWILAVAPDSTLRDGKRALTILKAHVLPDQLKTPWVQDVLAAALAEQGDFSEAVRLARAAELGARAQNQTRLADDIAHRAAGYRSRVPYRLPVSSSAAMSDP